MSLKFKIFCKKGRGILTFGLSAQRGLSEQEGRVEGGYQKPNT